MKDINTILEAGGENLSLITYGQKDKDQGFSFKIYLKNKDSRYREKGKAN